MDNEVYVVKVRHKEGISLIYIDASKIEKEEDIATIAIYRAKNMLEMEGVESSDFRVDSVSLTDDPTPSQG